MSINAKNVEIITMNGHVTLRGPVNSEDEKKRQIGDIANRIAQSQNVDNQLEVSQNTTTSLNEFSYLQTTANQRKKIIMSKKSVFCIATSRPQADQIVDQLKNANFSNNDIPVLFADKGTSHDFAHEKHTKAPEGAVTGAVTGGVIGGALGWIVGIGALAIPGVGPFIAAGPIMAALSGAAIGAAGGGITGGLIGLGIPRWNPARLNWATTPG